MGLRRTPMPYVWKSPKQDLICLIVVVGAFCWKFACKLVDLLMSSQASMVPVMHTGLRLPSFQIGTDGPQRM